MKSAAQRHIHRPTLLACILALSLALTACQTHYGHALLYEQSETDKLYRFARTGNNVIKVPADSKFRLTINDIHPGWLHQSEHKRSPDRSGGNWTRKQASHLFDKELWVLTRIESLSNTDILERESKVYFKATNIKLNSTSFLPIGLDISERTLFEHAADTSYRVSISVYEVDGFAVKRAIAKAYDSSPGLSGLAMDLLNTVKSLGLGVIGNTLADMLFQTQTEKSELERLLIKLGSSKEFGTTLHVMRTTGDDATAGRPGTAREFLLYDKLKSDANWTFDLDNQQPASSRKSLMGALDDLRDDTLEPGKNLAESTYMMLQVTWGLAADAEQLKSQKLQATDLQKNQRFIQSFKAD